MELSLGFSPCPNDTFIFDALVNKKIDTQGLSFDVKLEDVQTLNNWAINGKLDISKVSYGVLPLLLNQYSVLDSGGALGKGVGPLLITTKQTSANIKGFDPVSMSVAIPGEHTTAHMLFSLAYPSAVKKVFNRFSEIENAVLRGEVDAGVIIHENRFTYMDKGLVKIIDLGEYWEKETQAPIPLGGIVVKKNFDKELCLLVNQLIRKSVEFAFVNYPVISDYVKLHSQEMEEAVMRKHIDLYVNNYSITLAQEGRAAVRKLLEVYGELNQVEVPKADIFVEEPVTV